MIGGGSVCAYDGVREGVCILWGEGGCVHMMG